MRILLLPLSFIFRIIVSIRNKLYDYGILKIATLNAKVISVGNISAGGTGKTPMVEFIADYLLKKNKFTAIVLKGYKRIYDDIQVAELGYKNEDKKITTEKFGDEGLALLESFQNTEPGKGLMIIADDKKSGARLADSKFNADVIIVDDGFQHRKLFRDLDVVMVDFRFKRHLLPAGDLREPLKNLHRADIIIQNHKFDKDILKHQKGIPGNALDCIYVFESFVDSNNKALDLNNRKVTAFCGIADPLSFKNLFEPAAVGLKINLADFIKFPDHHNYNSVDIDKIVNICSSNNSECILTTHKDFVRIKYSVNLSESSARKLLNYPLYYAKIKLQIPKNPKNFTDKLDDLIKES